MNPGFRVLKKLDGRWVAAGMIVAYFGVIAVAVLVFHGTLHSVCNDLGVPGKKLLFGDFRDVARGVDRFMASDDRWSADSIAYSVSAFNYPKWWLGAGYLGLSVKTCDAFSIGMILLFYLSSFYVLGPLTWVEGIMAGLVFISPNIMTGIQRANGDLLIFSMMSAVLALRRSVPLATLIMTFAALLKIYPAASLVVLMRAPWRKNLFWLIAAVTVLAIDVLTSAAEYRSIADNTNYTNNFAFGSTPALVTLHGDNFSSPQEYDEYMVIGDLVLLAVMGLSFWVRPVLEIKPEGERAAYAFQLGAALYLGTFALGSNHDYRTVVLIFCLPLLFALFRETGKIRRWASAALMLIILYSCWRYMTGLTQVEFVYLKQIVAWAILALLSGILSSTFTWSRQLETR